MKSGSFTVLVLLLMAMAINSPTGELATAAPVPKEVINVQMTCRDCTCRTWVAYRPFESDTATEFFVDGPGLGQTTLQPSANHKLIPPGTPYNYCTNDCNGNYPTPAMIYDPETNALVPFKVRARRSEFFSDACLGVNSCTDHNYTGRESTITGQTTVIAGNFNLMTCAADN